MRAGPEGILETSATERHGTEREILETCAMAETAEMAGTAAKPETVGTVATAAMAATAARVVMAAMAEIAMGETAVTGGEKCGCENAGDDPLVHPKRCRSASDSSGCLCVAVFVAACTKEDVVQLWRKRSLMTSQLHDYVTARRPVSTAYAERSRCNCVHPMLPAASSL